MPPKLSVVIPFFNAEKYLNKCIKSVCAQALPAMEIILVDDGSTDSSARICKDLLASDTRLLYVHQDNSGSQAARKLGVNKSTGDYITFIDADDWIENGYYENVLERLNKNFPDIFCVGFTRETSLAQEKVSNNIDTGFYEGQELQEPLKKAICSKKNPYQAGIIPSVWSKFIKQDLAKKIFNRVDDFIKLGEDAVCTYGCISFARSIEVQNGFTGYHYVYNDTSIVNSYDRLYFKRLKILKKNLTELVNGGCHQDILSKQVYFYFRFMRIYGKKQYVCHKKKSVGNFFGENLKIKAKFIIKKILGKN